MKRKLSWALVLMLLLTTVMPTLAFAGEDEMTQLREQYEKVYRNKGYLYDLPYGLAKRDGDLPYGLAKRGGDLPFGLAKRGIIPTNVIKTWNLEAFEDFVEAVIEAYDGDSDLIDELEALLDAEPLNVEAVLSVLEEVFEEVDAEAVALEERIDEVYEAMENYGADQDFIDDIEALLDKADIDWDLIDEMIEELIMDSDIYAEALETYQDLVEEIDLLIADDEFEWPDTETGDSFEAVYETYNDLESPTMAELNEANRALSLMKDYLTADELYTIEAGEDILDELKSELLDLIEDLDFGTGRGEFDPGLETMLEELINQINTLSDPSIFDIIALKGSVDEMLESYANMRYIDTDERHDFIVKRYEVINDYIYEDLNDQEAEELYTQIEEFELPYGSLMGEYGAFLELYEAFMDIVD